MTNGEKFREVFDFDLSGIFNHPDKILSWLSKEYRTPNDFWRKEDRGEAEFSAVCPRCDYDCPWSERGNYCKNCGLNLG